MSAPRWPLPWDVELRGSGFAVVAADGQTLIDPDGPFTSHRAAEVCALGDRVLAAEGRIAAVRALCDDILSQPPDAGRTWAAREVLRLLDGDAA